MTTEQEVATLVDEYRSWLRDRTAIRSIHSGWVEISTPFLDRHNDYIQIYARNQSGVYELNDDGHTLRDLAISGCNLDSPRRQAILKVTLNGFGVEDAGGFLRVHASRENFSVRKHALIQAILAINDLFYLASSTVRSLFREDVEAWLDHAGIRFLSNIQLTGRSGYQHYFDFAIPKSKSEPERILKAITNPNKDTALTFITAWSDTVDQRPSDATAFAFLNDNEKNIPSAVISALRQYEIIPVLWSDRERVRGKLAA
ncbi:MAG: DUF1829 domain-containing protein [Hyphomicrobiaceae bacterium]